MNSSDSASIFFSLVGCALAIGVIFLFVYLIRKSNDEAKRSEASVNHIMSQIPQDKQMIFMMQFGNSKKSPSTAVLLALFLGGLGAHKFYLGQTGLGIFYLLFCWTYIPSIIALFEAFTLATTVAKFNEQKAVEFSMMLGAGR